MRILIADGERGVILADSRSGVMLPVSCSLASPYMPCATHELLLCACRVTNDVSLISRATLREVGALPAAQELTGQCVSPCGRYIYQLSGASDCVHTRSLCTGEILYSCQVGSYPRGIRLHPGGRVMVVAGGAAGEAVMLNAPELVIIARIPLTGCVCAADFAPRGIRALCTVDEGETQTLLLDCPMRNGSAREIARVSGQCGGLLALPGASVIGAVGGLMCVDERTGLPLWNLPCLPLCSRIDVRRGALLISDTLYDQAVVFPIDKPWLQNTLRTGKALQACFI